MRRWQLDHKRPLSLQLAADARLSQTDYTDDQSWQMMLGQGDDSAMTLQTAYGGRVGLASLVPMWQHENRTIYQALAYQSPPVVTAFAPGYLQIEASLLPDVTVTAEYWVAESHAITGQFTLRNASSADLTLRLDLYAHVIIRSQEQQVSILTLQDQTNALYLGKFANIDPVVLVEGGSVNLTPGGSLSAKVGQQATIPAGETHAIRWAHAALTDVVNSVRLARYWLGIPWDDVSAQVEQAAQAIPQVETGSADWDATIAFAYQQAVQSFLRPTEHLPHASFVSAREPINGYSENGTDYIRAWSGQNPLTAYLLTQAVACIDPALAQGIVRNYIAVQQGDSTIDWAPGLGGQRREMLALPLLARMAWSIYETTQDKAFIEAVFVPLWNFFERWSRADVDADQDGVPEWQHITQTGYAGWPIFNGGIDITLTETPDMVSYLLGEAAALHAMALELDDQDTLGKLRPYMTRLQHSLDEFYRDEQFVYRDRDTHATPSGAVILEKGKADEEHILALPLPEASRLVIEVIGGTSHKPRMSVDVHGLDVDGNEVQETVEADAFLWTYGRGTATTRTVFSQVDRVVPSGLSRVYRVGVRSVDLDELDMNDLLPLWTGMVTTEQASEIALQAENTLLKPNGLALYQQSDEPGADPSGIWVFWNTLMIEGLLRYGFFNQAVDLLKRLLRVQTATLRETGKFTPFYHEDDMHGIGGRMDISGMVPVHVLMQTFGLHIRVDGTVHVSEVFAWGKPIMLRQRGITIERDTTQTLIIFPSGEQKRVPAGVAQVVQPPNSLATQPPPLQLPEKPTLQQTAQPAVPVRIEVEIEDDTLDPTS